MEKFFIKLYSLIMLSFIPTIVLSRLTYTQEWFRNLDFINNETIFYSMIGISILSYVILLIRNYFDFCCKIDKICMPTFILSTSILLGIYVSLDTPIIMYISIVIFSILLFLCLITNFIEQKKHQIISSILFIFVSQCFLYSFNTYLQPYYNYLIIFIISSIFTSYFIIKANKYYDIYVLHIDEDINENFIHMSIYDLFVQLYAASIIMSNEYPDDYYLNYSSRLSIGNKNNITNVKNKENKPKENVYVSDCQGFE